MAFCFLEHALDGWTNNPQSVIAGRQRETATTYIHCFEEYQRKKSNCDARRENQRDVNESIDKWTASDIKKNRSAQVFYMV